MVRVLGNTWMPIGVGGNFMPGGTSGTSAEYYKCASVDTGGTVLDESTLVASGFGTRYGFEVDGTYTLRSGSGTDRVYVKGSIILSYNTGSSCWEFTAPDFEPDPLALTAASCETPWDATSWITVAGSPLSGATVSRSETTTSGNTWSGYKAVFDSGTGTWSFESDATEGLTYTSVTPIVGGIYSADALVIVSLLYTGTPTLTSPTGMTSESSDEWEISASSFYSTNSAPWKAFDGVTGSSSGWTGASNSSWWLQWQNKTKQVLVQKLRFQGTASGDIAQQAITSFILQGSDDGSTWTDLYTASGLTWTTGYEWKEFAFSNSKSYYYHRLANITVAANYPTIIELETYDM